MKNNVTIERPRNIIGEYIDRYYILDDGNRKIGNYKTEKGAIKAYANNDNAVQLVQETNCTNQDITICSIYN